MNGVVNCKHKNGGLVLSEIVKLDGFELVYQGGHHSIYCNGKKHLKVAGGKCEPVRFTSYAIVDYSFKCDCEKWRSHGRCAD